MAGKNGRRRDGRRSVFRIPFSILPIGLLEKVPFYGAYELALALKHKFPSINLSFAKIKTKLTPEKYISLCIISSLINLLVFVFLSLFIFLLYGLGFNYLLFFFIVSSLVSIFIFVQQISYPKLISARQVREIERNLIPVLQNMLVQLNSGIPLFNIFVNISLGDYGEISEEFENVVKRISTGEDQIYILEVMAERNPSLFFRRAIWQMVNGMKMGGDISDIIAQIISSLSEQQLIQIQKYGSQLNPLSMFYMLIAVILPSLGITFLIMISSFVSASGFVIKLVFGALFVFVTFVQLMFLGLIRARRPSLLR